MPVQLGSHGFPEEIDIDQLISLAQEVGKGVAAKQDKIATLALTPQYKVTGEAILSKTGNIETDVWIQKKDDGSTLTSADVWGNDKLIAGLQKRTVGIKDVGIITEENNPTANLAASAKPVIITGDSLDNTSADNNGFIYGGNDWSITIGCIDAQKNIVTGGVIYYPKHGLTFFTGKDNQVYIRRDGINEDIPLQGAKARTPEEIASGLNFLVKKEPVETAIDISWLKKVSIPSPYLNRCLVAISPGQRQQLGLPSTEADIVAIKGWSIWDLPWVALQNRLGYGAYNPDGTELDCMASAKNGFKIDTLLLGNQKTMNYIGFAKDEHSVVDEVEPQAVNPPVANPSLRSSSKRRTAGK